jgi:adenine phosphoribosyltransferase
VKEKKVTMLAPVHHYSYESITTRRVQTLFLSADGIEKIRGKKVVIVDDVVSTGGTIEAVKGLLAIAGATYLCTAAVFTEDGARDEVISLGNLPLFKS